MIRGLRKKFVLITMALVSVILLAVVAGILLYYRGILRHDSYVALQGALERPAGMKPPSFQLGGQLPEGFRREPVFVVEVDAGGTARLLYAEGIEVDEGEARLLAALVLDETGDRGELAAYGLRYLARQRGATNQIAFADLTLERQQVGSVALVTGLSAAGAFVVFLAASLFLARWALKPVEQAWQRQRQFVADASHELKTPLTVILANTGILKAHPQDSVAAQMTWVDNTEQEARRMKGLVDDLLFLAKGDDAATQAPPEPLDFSEVAATTALAFEPVAYEQGLTLEMAVQPGVRVAGNAAQLKQLVGILLDNAVKYAAPGSAVELRLERRPGQAAMAVHNQGTPIAPQEQKRLFERFYRADPSRAKAGYGLGLSIAKAIADAHHGKIGVESGPAGTVFTVLLPLV